MVSRIGTGGGGQRDATAYGRLATDFAAVALAALFAGASVAAGARPAGPLSVDDAPGSARAAHLAKGKVLVATHELLDPNFAETVVLLLEYGAGGAVGVVLNRPAPIELRQVLPDLKGLAERKDALHFGGPVEPYRALLLLRAPHPPEDGVQVFGDVYVTGSMKELEGALGGGKAKTEFRVYAGYAGWGPGQLDAEVGRGDWLVGAADAATVFNRDPRGIWDRLRERLEGQWVRFAWPVAS